MKRTVNVCVHDLGGSGGKAFVGRYDGARIRLEEVYRYPFGMTRVGKDFYWDIPLVIHNALQGIGWAAARVNGALDTFAATGFGNVLALLDHNDRLFAPSFACSSRRMAGVQEELFQHIQPETLYARTGVEITDNQSLMLMRAYRKNGDMDILKAASCAMQHVDALLFFLTGEKRSERTTASASGLYAPSLRNWAPELVELAGLTMDKLPPVTDPCSRLGRALPYVEDFAGVRDLQVANGPQHDTAAACFALPTTQPNPAFMIVGTFALCGIETDAPVVTDAAFRGGVGNEANPFGRNKLLCASRAMWFLERFRASQTDASGQPFSYEALVRMAEAEAPMRFLIDLENRDWFTESDDIYIQVVSYCRETGQGVIERPAQVVRCLLDSIAWFAHESYAKLERISGIAPSEIYAVNGGARNSVLMQTVANLTRKPVYAGVYDASSAGAVIGALAARGELSTLQECRELSARSTQLRRYEPEEEYDLRWAEVACANRVRLRA